MILIAIAVLAFIATILSKDTAPIAAERDPVFWGIEPLLRAKY